MNFPKLMIASDGKITFALLDGVFLGQGIRQIDFSAKEGESTIKLLDIDVEHSSLSGGEKEFLEAAEALVKYRSRVNRSGKDEISSLED